MPRPRPEIKAELLAEAEHLIDALLDWTDATETPNLAQIEDEVLKLRQRFAEKLAEAAVDVQATTDPLMVACPQCGRAMHQKKKRHRRRVESRVGGVQLKRAYYYCDHCRVGLFPPGSATAGGGGTLE